MTSTHTFLLLQYELDSLAGFLKISRSYYQNTKDTSFMNDNCKLRQEEKEEKGKKGKKDEKKRERKE